jgi:dTDP-4-dehydrorhamnose reductase
MRGRIWITGAGGLIGSCLVRALPEFFPDARIRALTRGDLDFTDFAAVERLFGAEQPSMVFHCAAMTKSPDCQVRPVEARVANVDATRHLAGLAERIPFICFSTDLVFDGTRGNYDESAPVNPLSIYAETKAEADRIVLGNPGHTVIRTSLNGGKSAASTRPFNEEMLFAWRSGRTLRLFTDEFRCPMAASVTARAVCELAGQGATGLYHLAGSERLSRWQIGQLLASHFPEVPARLEPASLKEYVGAPRPPDVSLDCRKAQARLSFPLPAFSQWLGCHADEWR